MVTQERARIAEEEVTRFLSKKTDLQNKITEMAGRRLIIEYALRLERSSLLEMIISDQRGLVEPVEEKVEILEKKLDAMDVKLDAVKQEEVSLRQKLEYAQGSRFEVVQVLEALQSELEALYYC